MRKVQIPLMLTVYNQGKELDWQFQIFLAKGYDSKFVQPLKTIIYITMLGREAI